MKAKQIEHFLEKYWPFLAAIIILLLLLRQCNKDKKACPALPGTPEPDLQQPVTTIPGITDGEIVGTTPTPAPVTPAPTDTTPPASPGCFWVEHDGQLFEACI